MGIIPQIEFSTDPELAYSRGLISRLRRRKLYRFAAEQILDPEAARRFPDKVEPQQIVTCSSGKLRENDIIVQDLKIDYGFKDRNPVDQILFYDRWDDKAGKTIPACRVSMLIADRYEERILRVYARDPSKQDDLREAFNTFTAQNHLCSAAPQSAKRPRLATDTAQVPSSSRKRTLSTALDAAAGPTAHRPADQPTPDAPGSPII
eukprot:NODE_1907_length_729_cov_88.560294_g1604_i0.p1 GENE.NODE_1907_length_729_cov_88.560294_g1604_i0~~NODE_1907_length_729_cov_88.560294_g1604_i0.p1  ORF type:complete len:215 (-),score=84.58 NODE_1907_length_729_cov_88.560294_g1604_i0:83-700(-)